MSLKRPEDRDVYVPKHNTPRAVPEFVWEDATGKYEGEDLERVRRKRPTAARVSHLERRVDDLDKQMAVGFTESRTKLDTLLSLAAKADVERTAALAREEKALAARRKHTIALIGALATAAAIVIAALSQGCV